MGLIKRWDREKGRSSGYSRSVGKEEKNIQQITVTLDLSLFATFVRGIKPRTHEQTKYRLFA